MLAIRGVYTGEYIQLLEDIHVRPNIRVIVTFLDDEPIEVQPRVPGSAKGQISIADDFAAPLDGEALEAFYR
ncbi:hypothetical protein U27_03104 [Candidatus Vecturithrix granuli]|uniref:DUF2281 domain-containing protein n=1 Tax=Vecturithrix granuli TaxID=1499967 RepID=A0A081BUY7_VECG1|nr:hypothetical protein U27_03104 [Candidatus Vecturithrix granuli]